MQPHIHGRRVYVTPMLCRHVEGELDFVLSRFGPREAVWNLDRPRLEPDRRKVEIKSWVQLHHLELMKSYGRSVARSIARSRATGISRDAAHLVTGWRDQVGRLRLPRLLCLSPVQVPPVVSREIERTNAESHSM